MGRRYNRSTSAATQQTSSRTSERIQQNSRSAQVARLLRSRRDLQLNIWPANWLSRDWGGRGRHSGDCPGSVSILVICRYYLFSPREWCSAFIVQLTTDQFSQMPILDKWTFKNPLLMWALRHGFLEIKIPHAEIVQRHVDQRKTVWEDNQKNGDGGCTTLVDSFLVAERDNRGKIEISPNDLAFGMVTAGSEST